ncbi:Lnb N-terminal periplasmic domain-containing protein [Vibrio porteresiae]|uniref:DUF4105 domain-containing protein n=1 Tax=Vibrio porteresiae DSM 19223 TaxID=1123496 RepID=A0ABZ0QGX4_9VIBR|nr:DUF4105 domain-containing protein [Vibrio porteresiae]WPC75452.1 DUF4105 domain-containing protein [Vibrio porteresiae DSM 19223]
MLKSRWIATIALWLVSLPGMANQQDVSPIEVPQFDIDVLSQDAYWLKLGHYLPALRYQYKSTVDSATFFLSIHGKTDPKQELQATILALYQPDMVQRQMMRCTFPARYAWLEKQLSHPMPPLDCPELNKWQEAMAPDKLTLVFPTAFMNNPSSMFGHTLLRIDALNQNKNSELVAYAINFAAQPQTDDNAALYAFKGLVGSYPGRFTVMPYYKKVREYNDIESRDIWEYPLRFTHAEVERVLLHLWELEQAEFDYYFFDENCSYQLLALLQLANHDLDLVSQFPYAATPSDTVKALVDAHLTERPDYRAAFGTRLLHESDFVDERLYLATRRLKEEGIYPDADEFSPSEQAAILEFAYEWLNFELYDEGLARNITAKQLTNILIARSKLDAPSPYPDVPQPHTSPDQGHGSARFGLGRQLHQASSDRTEFEWRPSYHDLFDAQAGFIPGAQISFGDLGITMDDQGITRLDHWYIVDAMALAPSNRVFDSLAWNMKFGLDRPDSHQLHRLFINGGAGKAWGRADGLHVYGLINGEINHGPLTDNNWVTGVGVRAGMLYSLGAQHRLGIEGDWLRLLGDTVLSRSQVNATWNWSITTNTALRSEVGYQHWYSEEMTGKITAYFYY